MNNETFTCNKCSTVAFSVTREYAEQYVAKFNKHFDSLSLEKQKDYYGSEKSSIEDYERCTRCGNKYDDFRPAKDGDCPIGCTLSPIIKS